MGYLLRVIGGQRKKRHFHRQGPLCLCFAPAMPSPLRGFVRIAANAANAFPKGPFIELLLKNKPLYRSWIILIQAVLGASRSKF